MQHSLSKVWVYVQALQSGTECRGRVFVGADGSPLTFEVWVCVTYAQLCHKLFTFSLMSLNDCEAASMLS